MSKLNGAQITWLGHATFKVTSPQGKVILIDPWITGNPAYPENQKSFDRVDLMLTTHGHADHIADAVAIAKQHRPTVVGMVELVNWFGSQGVENLVDLNKGGSETIQGITVTLTHALHSSSFTVNNQAIYLGEAASFVIRLENGLKIYHAGDTTVFSDMQLIGELYAPDIALLPIGDHYTMGPREAAVSLRLLGVKQVIPMHFGTFPLLKGTPAALREELQRLGLGDVEVIELKPGQTLS
ncbi:MAG: metal-dependent hydrolase [Chloroflexi bacterium]|nr:metal-dependent hydrolase [Chloroflexota bacterium]